VHNHLLRHFFHIKQTTTVTEYVEQFSDIVHHLLAHDPSFPPTVITNCFIDGLKKEIRAVVMMHRPQDLNTASSLALLQEEAIQDEPIKRFESSSNSKKNSNDNVKNSGESYKLNS
jgi:oligoendopeptidase F